MNRAEGQWRENLLIVGLLLAVTLPFAGKAFTIDDPTVLAVARQLRSDPLRPYSFTINWDDPDGLDQDAWTINNPPLASAYYAVVSAVLGEGEIPMHISSLVFPITAVLAMASLGRRFAGSGAGPAVALVGASAFLVLAHNLMLDIPCVALYLAGVALFISGSDASDARLLAAGGVVVGAACLAKYTGLCALPLLAAYVLIQRRPWHLLYLLVPVSIVFAWCLHNLIFYEGSLHIVSASMLLIRPGNPFPGRMVSVLVIMGGVLAFPPALAVWFALMRKGLLVLAGAMVPAAAIVYGWAPLQLDAYRPLERAACWIMCGLALALLVVAATAALSGVKGLHEANTRLRDRLFLGCWALGATFYNLCLSVASARYTMMVWPPLLLLLWPERSCNARSGNCKTVLNWVLAANVVWALLIACADAQHASAVREFVRHQLPKARAEARGEKVWCVGHWGFQYYTERQGCLIPTPERMPAEGEWIMLAHDPTYTRPPPGLRERLRPVATFSIPARLPLVLHKGSARAGFYSDTWGVLPYTFSRGPIAEFTLYRVAGGA